MPAGYVAQLHHPKLPLIILTFKSAVYLVRNGSRVHSAWLLHSGTGIPLIRINPWLELQILRNA